MGPVSNVFFLFCINSKSMINGPIAYGQNFEKSWNRKIYYHSIEEHPKINKIEKFGCKTL